MAKGQLLCQRGIYKVSTVEDQTSSMSQNTSLSSTVVATPKKRQKSSDSSHSYGKSEYCAICKVRYESPEDIETDSHWLNCGKECDWWVHARCANIHYENTDKGQRQLDVWTKDHFYCKKHMPRAVAVGWDKEKEQDVVIQEPRKQRFSKRVQKLVSQKKKLYILNKTKFVNVGTIYSIFLAPR